MRGWTKWSSEGSVKAMFQGSAYKKNLQTHLDDVKELATKIDQEALVRSQHSVRYIEKNVERIQQELVKLQSCSKSVQVDETTLQDIVTRIGHLLEEKLVNSTFSHFSSIAAIGPRNTNGTVFRFKLQSRKIDIFVVPQDQLLLTSTSSANLAPSSSGQCSISQACTLLTSNHSHRQTNPARNPRYFRHARLRPATLSGQWPATQLRGPGPRQMDHAIRPIPQMAQPRQFQINPDQRQRSRERDFFPNDIPFRQAVGNTGQYRTDCHLQVFLLLARHIDR